MAVDKINTNWAPNYGNAWNGTSAYTWPVASDNTLWVYGGAVQRHTQKGAQMPRSILNSAEERRNLSLADAGCEVREDPSTGEKSFVGHAAVFNSRTAIGNPLTYGFYEEIAPGSFTKTISEGDARMLVDHNSYYVVSRVSAGTLNLAQDAQGLAVSSQLDGNLSYVNDLRTNLSNGNITGMSFGFNVVKDDWTTEQVRTSDGQEADVEVRTIQEVRLIEVSAVTFPAYEETDAGLRYSLVPALTNRADANAIRRALKYRPDLAEAVGVVRVIEEPKDSEPGETTQDEGRETEETTSETDTEPAATTRNRPALIEARMRLLKARFGLPA